MGKLLHAVHETEYPARDFDGIQVKDILGSNVGCQNVQMFLIDYPPGKSAEGRHDTHDEIAFVVEGTGELVIDGQTHPLQRGVGAFVPAGTHHLVRNTGTGPLRFVSANSPLYQEGNGQTAPAGRRTVDANEVEAEVMGERRFRVLVDPAIGCHSVTQFIGLIPPSRAPYHSHPYEEVAYILEGEGRAWGRVGDAEDWTPIRAGSAIYMPPGVEHCLENNGTGWLRVLGVFSPAGSPRQKLPQPNAGAAAGDH